MSYTTQIDNLIDKNIDIFYQNLINSKDFPKFKKELNFVKYQKDIDQFFVDYVYQINLDEIEKIIKNSNNTNSILDIIKRYILYVFFLTIAYHYTGKMEIFINNIIEYSKNQSTFKFKASNYFNAENINNTIKFATIIKNIIAINEGKSKSVINKPDFIDTRDLLDEFGEEFVKANFNTGDEDKTAFNIIKTIIISKLFISQDKIQLHQILDAINTENGEYIFIDIVLPKTDIIDFNAIENALTPEEVEIGMASDIYTLLMDYENYGIYKSLSTEQKILELINNDIIVPIVDDFLLYHKDGISYDVSGVQLKKKKEDTRIKYIVNKIDNASSLYSENIKSNPEALKDTTDLFDVPLSSRKAILINEFEEIKIINKYLNQGKLTITSDDYFNDLAEYRTYPYINFKNFNNYGFNLKMNKTVDMMRYTTIENMSKDDSYIQLRVGSKNMNVSIVGFMLKPSFTSIHCLKSSMLNNIRNIKFKNNNIVENNSNGYDSVLQILRNTILNDKKLDRAIYWIIDPQLDSAELNDYEQIGILNDQKNIKLMIDQLYDDVIVNIFDILTERVEKMKNIKFYEFEKFIKNTPMPIPKNINFYDDLLAAMYSKLPIREPEYDFTEDKFFGMEGNIVKLIDSEYAPKKVMNKIVINPNIVEYKIEELDDTPEKYGAVCQHNATWNDISAMRKKYPNKFTELLIEFVQKFVTINRDDEYICKSCSNLINIKKYVSDGAYNSDGGFTIFAQPMVIPLHEIPEYQKYDSSIRNIDKMLDRLASVTNMSFLLESNSRQKNSVKINVIKNSIDLLLIHKSNMQNIYKNRRENVISKYGIDKKNTDLFIFDLENNIFIFSSKDKDHYKLIKRNNIYVYLILSSVLELSESQILKMGGDKICNYETFKNHGLKMFQGLKIIKNNKNSTDLITNYKVLCYLLFYISCGMTKYNMWYFNQEDTKTRRFNPLVQISIINTFVDLLNSVLEVNSKNNPEKPNHYLYNIIATRFFLKLNTTYSDKYVYSRINNIQDQKVIISNRRSSHSSVEPLMLGNFSFNNYSGNMLKKFCRVSSYFIKSTNKTYQTYYHITNLTNCPSGEFHVWKNFENTMKCQKCSVLLNELKYDEKLSKEIIDANLKNILLKMTKIYCKNDNFQNFIQKNKIDNKVCTKYNLKSTAKPESFNEMNDIINKFNNNKIKQEITNKFEQNKIETANNVVSNDIVNGIKKLYDKNPYDKFIDNFINKLINITSDNKLINDVYIIDHNYNGYSLKTPITLVNKDNRIKYTKNHNFFKMDVISYINDKLQIEVFYNPITLLLLGHKENNKDFTFNNEKNAYLKILYSLKSKLKYLGYSNKYVNIKPYIDTFSQYMNETQIQKNIIGDISRQRINNLKNIIQQLQTYIHKLYNKYNTAPMVIDETIIDDFMTKYSNNLNKFSVDSGNDHVFKNWKIINENIHYKFDNSAINIDIKNKYISIDDIIFNDDMGNLILFYIVYELEKLLEFNNNSLTKITLARLIIDMLNYLFDIYNKDISKYGNEIRRFIYIIHTNSFLNIDDDDNINISDYDPENEDEVKEYNEQLEEDNEMFNSMDIDGNFDVGFDQEIDTELDYEIDYD